MNTTILFPHWFKKMGWYILVPSMVLGICNMLDLLKFDFLDQATTFAIYSDEIVGPKSTFQWIKNNLTDEILTVLNIIGAIFVAFSKEKQEDEFMVKLRFEALVWSVYINYAVLVFFVIFFYGISFWYVMIFNLFAILFLFIFRFNYLLLKSKKSLSHEE